MRLESRTAIILACAAGLFAQERPLHFQGEVLRGNLFRKEIGHGLVFLLRPVDDGWKIAVEPVTGMQGTGCGDNYASVIGVPMRGYREVDLGPGYGNTALEALALSPRDVDFVLNAADCKREEARRTKLTWPSQYTQQEVQEAQDHFASSTSGTAVVRILDSKLSASGVQVEGKDYGKIDWVKFEVTVTFPAKL